jgi:hypothetical protein
VHGHENILLTETCVETPVSLTGTGHEGMLRLNEEAKNAAVLDSACTSTVCGAGWLKVFMDSLSPDERKEITSPGKKVLRFGSSEHLKSMGVRHITHHTRRQEVQVKNRHSGV